ncbi:hypothetical protein M409DRAFT_30039 [Zasmidium cellare ATCC 36951]|uniref:Transglycosylase SLT domain-containing protein n=1 Tax=Zasmidium cellare ATCC 36951 TaxID=1080233 RepID=A0A6A6BXK3_ZASCE|nr:uncharacterized protein M409DRAFT_30039 [Zasmidium cellare ATCC 36951]KAF2159564.1 hypothetical protein M409DRAFT_30039 [Zasmidium cellare ATCC 36951]
MVMVPFELLLLSALATSPFTLASAQPIASDAPSINDIPLLHPPGQQQPLTPDDLPKQQPISSHDSASSYRCYNGDPKAYPPSSQWLSYSTLWDLNRETILSANGGDVYLQHYIQVALEEVSSSYDIDPRFLLAILLQESKGDVQTPCIGPEPRCGLLHAYKGSIFNAASPQASITKMLEEGIKGAAQRGPGLLDLLNGKPKFANVDVGDYFAVARAWNSGAVKEGDLDVLPPGKGRGRGEAGFVNDVANRLMGWNGRGKGFGACRGEEGRKRDAQMEWYYPSFLADL